MGMFNICRVEDFHLWYSAAKYGFFAAIVILAFLATGVGYLRYCKKISEDLINAIKFRNDTEKEGGDNWPDLQPGIFGIDSSNEFTYADFEKSCTQIELKKKELCAQK